MREFRARESQIAGVVAEKKPVPRRAKTAMLAPSTVPGGSGSRPPSAAGGELENKENPKEREDRKKTATMTVGYSAPTASSRARLQSTISNAGMPMASFGTFSGSGSASGSASGSMEREREREHRPSLVGLFLPPHAAGPSSAGGVGSTSTLSIPRPTTPSQSPSVLRLTMPTSSTRAKTRSKAGAAGASPRINVANVFGPGSGGEEGGMTMRERAGSVSPGPPRVTSPTTLGARGTGSIRARIGRTTSAGAGTISRGLATGTAVGARLMKVHKTFGDGTELDGFEDLVVEKEKERKFRVSPKAPSPKGPGSRVVSGASTATVGATAEKEKDKKVPGTIGRRTPSGIVSASSGSATAGTSGCEEASVERWC